MRATGVIVRFLSLLDVTLCLLAVLMVLLVTAQYRVGHRPVHVTTLGLEGIPTQFLLLYGGTYGDLEGRIFPLEKEPRGSWRRGDKELKSKGEVDHLAQNISTNPQEVRVMILLSDRGFDRAWPEERRGKLEKEWERPVYFVRRVRFAFE
jgi:hypothetical protein